MRPNPAAPVNLVEKPVHDHEQNDDREQTRRRLQIERRDVVAQLAHDADRDKPRHQTGAKRNRGADRNRPAMLTFRAHHARGDRGENEDAFQPFAENKDADIEKSRRWISARAQRIRVALRGHALPDEDRRRSRPWPQKGRSGTRGGRTCSGRGCSFGLGNGYHGGDENAVARTVAVPCFTGKC